MFRYGSDILVALCFAVQALQKIHDSKVAHGFIVTDHIMVVNQGGTNKVCAFDKAYEARQVVSATGYHNAVIE